MKVTHVDTVRCEDDGQRTVLPGTKIVAQELIIEGGPMRYRSPQPVTAELVAEIVRAAIRAELGGNDRGARYWSPERAARECGIGERTFREWMAVGKVRFFKPCRRVLIDPAMLAEDLLKFQRQRVPKRRMKRNDETL